MRSWCTMRALGNAQTNAIFLQHWIAPADFDGSESDTDHLQFHNGDVLEQWQTRPDGLAFGRFCRYGPAGRHEGRAIGFFSVSSLLKT